MNAGLRRSWRQRLDDWLDAPGQTNRNAIVAGMVSGVLLLAVPVAVGLLLSAFDLIDLSGKLPAALVAGALGTGLVLGLAGGVRLAQLIYRPRLDAARLRYELEEEKRRGLEPDAEALQRLTSYTNHFLLVLEDVIAGRHGLDGFPQEISDELSLPLCVIPSSILKNAAAIDATFSLWVHESRRLRRDRYAIKLAPAHTAQELKDFAVLVHDSWLEFAQRNHRPPDRVRKIDDLSVPGLVGADLDVFREHGYCALRVVPIPHEDDFVFLVILSKTPRAFSKWEDQWLTLLSAALSLAAKQAAVAS